VTKTENVNRKRKGKREYLNNMETREILKDLNRFFETRMEVKRIRNGEHQTLETLINEETLLFAKYLHGEATDWRARCRYSIKNLNNTFSLLFIPWKGWMIQVIGKTFRSK
jgi:hypothetical protein